VLKNLFLKQDHRLLKKRVLIRHDLQLHLEAVVLHLHRDQRLRSEVVVILLHQNQHLRLEVVVIHLHRDQHLLEVVVFHRDLALVEVEDIAVVVVPVVNLAEVECVAKE
jgi:hypothetical protein